MWLLLKNKWWQVLSNLQHLPQPSSNSTDWINPPKIFSSSIFTQFCLGQFAVHWLLFTTCSEVNPLIWQNHFSLNVWGNQSGSWSLLISKIASNCCWNTAYLLAFLSLSIWGNGKSCQKQKHAFKNMCKKTWN